MRYQKVDICGLDTAHLPVMKEEEKIECIQLAQGGDMAARQRMIQGNLRLVLSVVQKFSQRGECLDDLFQVGCIGLMKAIDHFDTSLNLRFSTYGQPMIAGEIRRFLRDNNSVRVSRSMRDLAYKALQTRDELQKKLNRDPSRKEIATAMHEKTENINLALESISEPISIYEPVFNDDGGDTLFVMDQLGDNGGEESWISGMQLRAVFASLTTRERAIMCQRFMVGKTQTQVAQKIGISQAQVSRLEKSAIARIRSAI